MNALSLADRPRQHVANGHAPELDPLLGRFFGGFDFSPDLRVDQTDTEFRVSIDLPGVEATDVELSFHDGALNLKAQRKTARGSSRIERSVALSQDVDADRIAAALKNGVLTVTLPKKPEHQPKRIQIE